MYSLRARRLAPALAVLLVSTVASSSVALARDSFLFKGDDSSDSDVFVVDDPPLGSDSPWFFQTGRQLRVQTGNGRWTEGTVASVDGDTVLLAMAGTDRLLEVPASRPRIQVQVGERSQAFQGFAVGLGMGTVVGGALGAQSGESGTLASGFNTMGGAIAGFLVGGLVGALAGDLAREPVWDDVYYYSVADGPANPGRSNADPDWMWDQTRAELRSGEEARRYEVRFDIFGR